MRDVVQRRMRLPAYRGRNGGGQSDKEGDLMASGREIFCFCFCPVCRDFVFAVRSPDAISAYQCPDCQAKIAMLYTPGVP